MLIILGLKIPGFFTQKFGISWDIPGFIFCSNTYLSSLVNMNFSSVYEDLMLNTCFRTLVSDHLFQNTSFRTHVSEPVIRIPGFLCNHNPGIFYSGIFQASKSRDYLVPGFFDPGISRDIPGPGYPVDIPISGHAIVWIQFCSENLSYPDGYRF